jgi:hypothetical protein
VGCTNGKDSDELSEVEYDIGDWLNVELWSGELSRRVMISESYVRNHAQTTPTFPNDHTHFLNSLDVSLN